MPLHRLAPAVAGLCLCGGLSAQPATSLKPVVTYKGHADPVYAVAVSPDGRTAATGSFDKSIKLWDLSTGKELRTLGGPNGHQSLVLTVAFSPTGDLLASGGADNFARVWDVPSVKPARELTLGTGVARVAASPDGKAVAAAAADGRVRIWSIADGKQLHELTGHSGAVTGMGFANNGQTLVTTGADRTLRYWNASTGQAVAIVGVGPVAADGLVVHPGNAGVYTAGPDGVLRFWLPQPAAAKKLPDHAGAVTAAAVSADGNFALTGGADKALRWVNLGTGKATLQLAGAAAAVECVAVMPNATTFAAGTADGKLLLWGNDGKPRADWIAHTGAVRAVAFHPSQPLVVTAGEDGMLKAWPVPAKASEKTPTATMTVESHKGGVRGALVLPSGQVVTAGGDKVVRSWDVGPMTKKAARSFGTLSGAAKALAASRDGAVIAAAAGKAVKLWQVGDGKELPFPALPFEPTTLAFSSDRTKLVIGSGDKTAWVYEVATGQPLQFFPQGGAVTAVAAHPSQPAFVVGGTDKAVALHSLAVTRVVKDPEHIRGVMAVFPNATHLVTGGAGASVTGWNLGNGNKERTYEAVAPVTAVAVSRNSQLLAVAGGAEPTVHVITAGDGKVAGTFRASAKVTDLAFHPNGQLLTGALADKSATTWNVLFTPGQPPPAEFGGVVQTFAHPTAPTSLTYLGEGGQLATGCGDGSVRVWKVASDLPVKALQHPNLVDAVAFDKTGTLLATACHDGIVRIWDVAKGQAVKQISAHTQPQPNPVYAIAWTPDAKGVISASYDKSIKVWDAGSGNLLREIKPGVDRPPVSSGVRAAGPGVVGAAAGSVLNAPPAPGHRDQVFALAVTKDGKYLASGSSDRTVKLWELGSGNLVREFPNPALKPPPAGQPRPSHPGFVHSLRFSADGKDLISVGTAPRNQGYLAVWSVGDGKLLAGGEQPFGPIYAIDLAPDGSALLGCGPRVRAQSESEAVLVRLPGR
jgi:WD40 repeat protein